MSAMGGGLNGWTQHFCFTPIAVISNLPQMAASSPNYTFSATWRTSASANLQLLIHAVFVVGLYLAAPVLSSLIDGLGVAKTLKIGLDTKSRRVVAIQPTI